MSKSKELIEKYKLLKNSYYSESPYVINLQASEQDKEDFIEASYRNAELNEKWKERIPDGWYGFDLHYPVPKIWFDVIDEFLEYVQSVCPNFEILQQKIKLGGFRCYLNKVSNEVQEEVYELESVLYDKHLIY